MNGRVFGVSVIASLTGLIALALAALYIMAVMPSMYVFAMNRSGVFESAGVSRDELIAVAADVARYIGQRNPNITFDRVITMDGQPRPELNSREIAHMRDIHRLFQMTGGVLLLFGLACVIAGTVTRYMLKSKNARRTLARMAAGRGLITGSALTAIIALAMFIATQTNFYKFFIFLHERLFSNDLWYMDPRTDVLIRMMPGEFYMVFGAIIGMVWIVGLIGVAAAGVRLTTSRGQGVS